MVSQRKSHQLEGNGRDHQVPIRGRHGDSRRPAISGLENVINGLLMKDLDSYLEPILRRVVRQEVERKIPEFLFPRATPCQGGASGAISLELRFINNPPETIFTLSNVIAEDEETPLKIGLFDVRSQSVVSDGPLSSAKVEILTLDGDFCSQRGEDWTEEQFNANILSPREGKEPLLNGDRIITLENGVGSIPKIKITDNSRWRRSGKFILGAKVLQLTSYEASIKEGVSKPFMVKDNRGELYKKHHPPRLDDDVWRLEKISKNGKIYPRLCAHGIRKVRDLLRSYNTDPSSLLEKVGKIAGKLWDKITEHAKECVIDDSNLYMYYTAEPPVGLLFNCIYILVGVTFDGQNYCSPDTLAPAVKRVVEVVKQHAYKNLDDLKSIGDQTCVNFQSSLASYPQAGQASGPDQGLQQLHFPIAQQGQIETWAGSDQPSTSYADEGMQYDHQTYASPFPELAPMLQNSLAEGEFFPGMQIEGNSWAHVGSPWIENENLYIQFTNGGQENGSHFNSYGGAEFGRSEKPKAVWYKILIALKWVISVRRDAAAKRMAKPFYYKY